MPDIAIVPTAVVPGDGAQYVNGIAGAEIAAGDVCVLDTAAQRFVHASSTALTTSRVRGIASHAASEGQPLKVQISGLLNMGSPVLVVGEVYALSGTTPGKIMPYAELATADFVSILGIGQTTSLLQLRLWVTELARG